MESTRSPRFDGSNASGILMRLLSVPLVALALIACSNTQDQSNVMIKMGPDQQADLVYLFKEGTTWQQILEFQRTVTGIPNETGTGYASLPGEMSAVAVRVRGHDAEAITFKPNATHQEKDFYKSRVLESPLIYEVYENVIPSRITASSSPIYKSH